MARRWREEERSRHLGKKKKVGEKGQNREVVSKEIVVKGKKVKQRLAIFQLSKLAGKIYLNFNLLV